MQMKVYIVAPYTPIDQGWFVALLLAYPSLHQVTTTTPETCYNSISFSFGGLVCSQSIEYPQDKTETTTIITMLLSRKK